jgi:DNA-binding NarL/FixJ family response regulator
MSARILEVFSGKQVGQGGSPVRKLSDREFEVFQLIGRGVSNRAIAEQLHLSIKTVEVHRAHIKEKLGLKTATELVRYALRWADAQGQL